MTTMTPPERPGPIDAFCSALAHAHRELLELGGTVLALLGTEAPHAGLAPAITEFSETLLNHHRSEDVFFFPAFRAAGRLSAADWAFLAERDAEHVPIHRLGVELQTVDVRLAPSKDIALGDIVAMIEELHERSVAHFAAEEAYLTADRVAAMVTGEEMIAIQRDMGKHWNSR
jgi:Hemerythrin HHE cation binding domain